MRKVVVTEFLTLDGVMEAPGGEFHPDGKGAWTFQFFNDEAGKFKFDELFARATWRMSARPRAALRVALAADRSGAERRPVSVEEVDLARTPSNR